MEARADTQGWIDARVHVRRDTWIVGVVQSGALRDDLYGHLRRQLGELLMRPDRAGWTTFDGTGTAAQDRGNGLLGLIGLCLRRGVQGIDCVTRQDVEPGHGLGKWQGAKQWAARRTGGYTAAVSVRTAYEGVESVNGSQQAAAGDEAPLDQVSAGYLSVGKGFDDFGSIPAGILRFLPTTIGTILGHEEHFILTTLTIHK